MNDNLDRQQLEVEALESIFEGLTVTNNKATVNLNIELDETINLNGTELHHIPPVKFKFKLTPLYPSTSPPLIHLSASWLSLTELTVPGARKLKVLLLL